jgi:hypothetical protein
MEGDRKYSQRGYMDSSGPRDNQSSGEGKPRPKGPKPPIDVTGPRLPRLVESITASRCYSCATTLPNGIDFNGNCPKCNAALHCCKQCSWFEPSTRFQCTKPIKERIAVKDAANQCEFFRARVTVARDSAPAGMVMRQAAVNGQQTVAPKTANDARIAFDNLFKK